MTPRVIHGSIFDADADAIVNPANLFLANGAGLARQIEQRAGPEFRAECKVAPTLAAGQALLTTAGKLPYKGIINVVGPVWSGGGYHEAVLLGRAMDSILHVARANGYARVACPAISCGLFRFPVDKAARILVYIVMRDAIERSTEPEVAVTFYVTDPAHYREFIAAGAV